VTGHIENEIDLEHFARLSVATGFQYFKTMNDALVADTKRCLEECLRIKSELGDGAIPPTEYAEMGFWYRGLARATMSYAEGLLYVMRQLIVFAEDRGDLRLSDGESWLVRERQWAFNPNAKEREKRIKERGRFNRLLENFVLTFDLFPQIFGSSFEIDYSDKGWKSFQELIELRNSATHPKTVDDVLLRPEWPNLIKDAAVWFLGVLRDMTSSFDLQMIEEDLRRVAKTPAMQEILAKRRAQRAG